MKPHFSLLLTLLAAQIVLADTGTADRLLRESKPADALHALQGESGPEASFWRGRALIALGRLEEASRELQAVPVEHHLYTYAAKALLYCAWKSNSVDFAVVATPMATSSNKEISALATAALAEYWLRQPRSQDNSALERLRNLANNQQHLQPLLRLLEIDNLRQKGEFDKAIELCRSMENDRELTLIMRQRVRLALSEVYYAKEASAEVEDEPAPGPALPLIGNSDDERSDVSYDEGKGEETLLQFISANPDSPLLEEAFRRLWVHEAFEKSEYARTKLREWMMEPLKSHRAAMALLIQQHLLNPEGAHEIPLDVTCANTAAATCPNEPATRTILLEQTRWFLERNKTHEALLYLGMIQGDDVHKQFFEAQLHDPAAPTTARAYLECARLAPESLRGPSLVNALICALKSGDTATQDELFSIPDLTSEQHYRLLRARAAYWLQENPAKAQSDIAILLAEPAPSADLRADVEMDRAYLELQLNPENAYEMLQRSDINQKLTTLSNERQLRFFALQEEALRRIAGDAENQVPASVMELIKGAAGKVRSPHVVAVLTLHLASLQSTEGKHEDALRTLNTLSRKYPKGDFVPRALYMSARECEFIGNMDSLRRAVQLYAASAERSDELATKATIRRAAVLLRLGKHEETEHTITALLRSKPEMRAEDKAMAHAVLANSQALLGTPEGRLKAVEIASQAVNDSSLPRWWKFRALLHHGTLCARAGMNEEALRDYETIIGMEPASGENPTSAEWHILYSASSSAVLQLLHLKRYAEAADMCDRIAQWNKEYADPAKRKQFADWAQFIRQTNFVNNPSIPF